MDDRVRQLREADRKAQHLFAVAEERGCISPGQTEKELNDTVWRLAEELFGIRKNWHKRIVRAGPNTLLPYRENPPNLLIADNDILFFDFGPVFEEWEADIGRTYVIGDDPIKKRLRDNTVTAWQEGKAYFDSHPDVTGSELYAATKEIARLYGWEYGGPHCGHLIGSFPHERIQGEQIENYIHPDNHVRMRELDRNGAARHWIYEIHFVDHALKIGGFFEQLLTGD